MVVVNLSVNGNPAPRTPRRSRNRESQSSNVCVPPPPVPSAPANPSSGSGRNRDVELARPLSRTGSWSSSEKSEESRDEKPVWGEKSSWGASGGRGWGNATSTTRSGGSRDCEVNPLANDLKADDLDQENTGINFDAYEDVPVTISGLDIPVRRKTFAEMDLGEDLNLKIKRYKFAEPTTLQKYVIPILLAGRDLMACAQTGSGKTAAFCFPIIAGIRRRNAQVSAWLTPLALILSPTIELSCQVHKEARKFAYKTGIKVVVAHGEAPITDQLLWGVNVLVATPGGLADLLEKGRVSLSMVKYLALYEADRMLDMGFEPQIRKIVEQMGMPSAGERQTMLFSATFPKEIQRLASDFLYNCIFLAVGTVGASTGLPVHSLGTLLIHSSRENIKPVNKPPGDCSKKFHHRENHVAVGYFDGASSKRQNCGCGVTLILSPKCSCNLFWNGGTGSSMMAEILALWGLLWFASHLCLKKILIFGDSKVVIEHMNKNAHIAKEPLAFWLEIINHIKNQFTSISFCHVMRDTNSVADLLSRKGLGCRPGTMHYRFIRADGNNTSGTVDLPVFFGYDQSCFT